MISSSNFVAIAQLVVLARKDPRTASPFSSLLDPVTLTSTLFPLRAFLRKMNIRKESSIGACPIMNFKVTSLIHRQYLLLLQLLLMFVFP